MLAPLILPPAAPGAAAGSLAITLEAITPAVVTGTGPVTITGTLRNTGAAAIPATDIVVRASSTGAESRSAVTDWANGTGPADGRELGRATASAGVPAGGTLRFSVTINGLTQGAPASWGAIPVAVSTGDTHAHTFLGYHLRKEYVPINLALAVPILTPPDPHLWGSGVARAQAWTALADSTSRPNRIIAATTGHQVDWIVDGALLTPPAIVASESSATSAVTTTPAGAAPGTPTASPTAPAADPTLLMSYADSTDEVAAREALRRALTDGAAAHGTLTLPAGDPDVLALAGLPRSTAMVAADIQRSTSVLTDRELIAWPAAGTWTSNTEPAITRLLGGAGPGAATSLVSAQALNSSAPGYSAPAVAVTASGAPLLVSDPGLSASLTAAASADSTVSDLMRFLADSAALVNERSGTERSALAVADRSIDPNVSALGRFLSGVESIPWLALRGAGTVGDQSPAQTSPATRAPATPAAPLTQDSLASLSTNLVAGGQIRDSGASFTARGQQSLLELANTGWRGNPTGWRDLNTQVRAAAGSAISGIQVEPKQITFLAESGRIQITVVNTLDVAVRDIELTVVPDNPKLRLADSTTTLRIGPRSRTTVTLAATALAAGSVPLRTTLATPDGTILSAQSPVQIQVTPTGPWIYVVVGALGLLALVGGLWRGRRARRAASAATAQVSGTVEA